MNCEKRYIHDIKNLSGGNQLRQGDGAELTYELIGKRQIFGKDARIRLYRQNTVVFETNVVVDDKNQIKFTVDEALPTGRYGLEVTIDDYKYPSHAQETLNFIQSTDTYPLEEIKSKRYQEIVDELVKSIQSEIDTGDVDFTEKEDEWLELLEQPSFYYREVENNKIIVSINEWQSFNENYWESIINEPLAFKVDGTFFELSNGKVVSDKDGRGNHTHKIYFDVDVDAIAQAINKKYGHRELSNEELFFEFLDIGKGALFIKRGYNPKNILPPINRY